MRVDSSDVPDSRTESIRIMGTSEQSSQKNKIGEWIYLQIKCAHSNIPFLYKLLKGLKFICILSFDCTLNINTSNTKQQFHSTQSLSFLLLQYRFPSHIHLFTSVQFLNSWSSKLTALAMYILQHTPRHFDIQEQYKID